MRTSLSLVAGLLVLIQGANAEDVKQPKAADVRALQLWPQEIRLVGSDDSRQIILTAALASERSQDVTSGVTYEVADPKIAKVSNTGRVLPLSNGKTTITARLGDKSAQVSVLAEAIDQALPISFPNHIVPVFTKLGCNSGGCHGKSGGQNGFSLSLLGFVPELDFQTLVKENRGRRIFPAAPDNSLLLLKGAGVMAHAGGKRFDLDSDEYKIIRRWIASGLSYGSPQDPNVTHISVYPQQRVTQREQQQQIAILAHYTDGGIVDVTRRAQYESNDPDIAVVDGTGLVRTLDVSGEAAVMARYQGQVTTFRVSVPLGKSLPEYRFDPQTVVDRHTQKKWQELGIVPSDLTGDESFLRRVSIDLTGTLPSPEQVKKFLADTDPKKRDRVIDSLLETQEYSYYFANRWADILRVKRGSNQNQSNRAYGTFAFHTWIRDSIASDKPYHQFVREILGAIGNETQSPPTTWYRDLQKPEQFVDDACQLFLGVRMACAQCHHHPYEKWSQDDYWGMAAFFSMVGRKNQPIMGVSQGQQNGRLTIFNKGTGSVTNTRTNQPAIMRPLDGEPVKLDPGEDPRQRLADWLVDAKNPFFAKAVANRYWAHFMGKGIVDPIDDMRVTNPPSNPELLDALAKELVDHNYSLKHLIQVICKSRTYQLSSIPNEFNRQDKKAFARYYPRRMSAEVLYDAVSQVTSSPASFAGLPTDRNAPNRAIMLPDESYQSYFLDVFGRPQRISACECERVTEANLAQALHLLNSQELHGKLTRVGGRSETLARDPRPDQEKIEELFLWALGRRPSAEQLDLALENIRQNQANKKLAYENILWALINTKEFSLIQ